MATGHTCQVRASLSVHEGGVKWEGWLALQLRWELLWAAMPADGLPMSLVSELWGGSATRVKSQV